MRSFLFEVLKKIHTRSPSLNEELGIMLLYLDLIALWSAPIDTATTCVLIIFLVMTIDGIPNTDGAYNLDNWNALKKEFPWIILVRNDERTTEVDAFAFEFSL